VVVPARTPDEPEMIRSLQAPPGRMGLVLDFFEEGRAPVVKNVDPRCPFGTRVKRGDRLLSIARLLVTKPGHLTFKMDEEREVNFVVDGERCSNVGVVGGESATNPAKSPDAPAAAVGIEGQRKRLRIHIKLPSASTDKSQK